MVEKISTCLTLIIIFLNSAVGYTCDSTCKTCSGPTFAQCTSCHNNTFLFVSSCQTECASYYYKNIMNWTCIYGLCPSTCECHKNDSQTEICSGCSKGNYYYNAGCVNSTGCPANHFADDSTMSCILCQNCSNCTSEQGCLECNQNLLKFEKKCVDKCPESYYLDNTKKKCLTCGNCSRCSSSSYCYKCKPTYFFFENNCYQKCPENTVEKAGNYSCIISSSPSSNANVTMNITNNNNNPNNTNINETTTTTPNKTSSSNIKIIVKFFIRKTKKTFEFQITFVTIARITTKFLEKNCKMELKGLRTEDHVASYSFSEQKRNFFILKIVFKQTDKFIGGTTLSLNFNPNNEEKYVFDLDNSQPTNIKQHYDSLSESEQKAVDSLSSTAYSGKLNLN